jgi:hypothetical protein
MDMMKHPPFTQPISLTQTTVGRKRTRTRTLGEEKKDPRRPG